VESPKSPSIVRAKVIGRRNGGRVSHKTREENQKKKNMKKKAERADILSQLSKKDSLLGLWGEKGRGLPDSEAACEGENTSE